MSLPRGKWIPAIVIYLTWQVAFSIAVSPLGFKILTAKQMGYTLNTIWLGLAVAAVLLVLSTLLARVGAVRLYADLSYIRTREDFDKFWNATLRGCDDGIIAETHWTGVVFSLFLVGFAIIGIPFPLNVIPAIIARWAAHVGAHSLFPKESSGGRMFGSMKFVATGLGFEDAMSSISFVLSGNIIAPILLHHLGGYISTWAGNKEKVAKYLGLEDSNNKI